MGSEIVRSEYPRVSLIRKDWVCLNGVWEFGFDFTNSGEEKGFYLENKKFSERILVPYPPESKLSGIGCQDFMVSVWYRKSFEIPETFKNKRVFIHFGAIDYKATVWLNQEYVGNHYGGYTPFSFEITKFLKRGKNILTVKAFDDTRSLFQPSGKQSMKHESHGCCYTRVTGIWQTVWLEAVEQSFIKSLKSFPDVDTGEVFLIFEIDGATKSLHHPSGKERSLSLKVEIMAEKEIVAEKVVQGKNLTFATLKIPNPTVWELDHPFLYKLNIYLIKGEEEVDKVESYFGYRKIEIRDKKIFLNNRPIFLRMVLDQGYHPDGIYTAKSDEDLKRDIEIAKKFGFNGARLHQKIFDPRFLYWADRLGYLVWTEYPSWGIEKGINSQAFEKIVPEWTDIINRDFNHPSIIGWCPLNETSTEQDPNLVRTLYRLTKSLDPTRLVIDTSGYVHVETDIYDCHNYEQNPKKFKDYFEPFRKNGDVWRNYPDHDAHYSGQPYFVSEYGGIWWEDSAKRVEKGWGYGKKPSSKKEFLDRYRDLTEALLFHPKICGFCYTQLYDVEQEVNGLCDYWRSPKFSYSDIRKINIQKADIEK